MPIAGQHVAEVSTVGVAIAGVAERAERLQVADVDGAVQDPVSTLGKPSRMLIWKNGYTFAKASWIQ